MFTTERPFTPEEEREFEAFIERAYQDFLTLVAQGRSLTREQVREVARGRVWTGRQAQQHRLVDHLGGFSVALARARALAGIEEDDPVQLRFYPEVENPFTSLGALFGMSAESAQGLARLNAILSDPRMQRALRAMREEEMGARAESPAFEVR